jgi:hypothetical protein
MAELILTDEERAASSWTDLLAWIWQYNGSMADSESRQHSEPLQIRITPELLAMIRRAADADNRSVSSWARVQLEKAAQRELKKGKK